MLNVAARLGPKRSGEKTGEPKLAHESAQNFGSAITLFAGSFGFRLPASRISRPFRMSRWLPR
jgi:hypothetical protein